MSDDHSPEPNLGDSPAHQNNRPVSVPQGENLSEELTRSRGAAPRGDGPVRLSLRAEREDYAVAPELFPAELAIEEGKKNFTTGKPLGRQTEALFEASEPITAYQEQGWLFPMQESAEVRAHRTGREFSVEPSQGSYTINQILNVLGEDESVNWEYPLIEVVSHWLASLPDGYSALTLPLTSWPNTGCEAVPVMADLDGPNGRFASPARITTGESSFDPGMLLGRLFPYHRERAPLDGVITTDGDTTPADEEMLVFSAGSQQDDIPWPVPAGAYFRNQLEAQQHDYGCNIGRLAIAKYSTQTRDALRVGWTLPVPDTLEMVVQAETASPDPVSVTAGADWPERPATALLTDEQSALSGHYYRLQPGWSVTVPAGYDLMVVPEYINDESRMSVIPEYHADPGTGEPWRVDVTPLVELEKERFEIAPGYGLARLIPLPVDHRDITVETSVANDRDEAELTRVENGHKIADYYREYVRGLHPEPRLGGVSK